MEESKQSRPIETPERRADLEQRLETQIRRIADRSVQEQYRNFFRDRLAETLMPAGGPRAGSAGSVSPPGRSGRFAVRAGVAGLCAPAWPIRPRAAARGRSRPVAAPRPEVLLALLLNHPFLLAEVGEEIAAFELPERALDSLCRAILEIAQPHPGLDAAALQLHLSDSGFGQEIAGILTSQVWKHAGFARPGADAEDVRLRLRAIPRTVAGAAAVVDAESDAERQAADADRRDLVAPSTPLQRRPRMTRGGVGEWIDGPARRGQGLTANGNAVAQHGRSMPVL